MNFDHEFNLEHFETVYYCKTLKNNNELCIVCQCDETEDGEKWDRYKLKCGHISHSRCVRRWCFKKNCINCPYCGDIAENIKKKKYVLR